MAFGDSLWSLLGSHLASQFDSFMDYYEAGRYSKAAQLARDMVTIADGLEPDTGLSNNKRLWKMMWLFMEGEALRLAGDADEAVIRLVEALACCDGDMELPPELRDMPEYRWMLGAIFMGTLIETVIDIKPLTMINKVLADAKAYLEQMGDLKADA